MKKRVAFDIDNVLYNDMGPFIPWFQVMISVRPLFRQYKVTRVLRYEDCHRYHWTDTFPEVPEPLICDLYSEFLSTYEFKNIRPIPGAVKALTLVAKKRDPFTLTARDADKFDVRARTHAMLDRDYTRIFSEQLFSCDFGRETKLETCLRKGAVLLVDDSPVNAAIASHQIPVIMRIEPWTREIFELDAKIENILMFQDYSKLPAMIDWVIDRLPIHIAV